MVILTTSQTWKRFAQAAVLTTVICLAVAFILLKTTGVPPTYPSLLPQQVISGTVGGALLIALGYRLLASFVRDRKTLNTIFIIAGVILLIASFHPPIA